jgi:hypothetical protein
MVTPKDSDPHFALLRRLDRGTLRCGILRVSNHDVHRNAPIARLFGSEIQWEKDIYKAQGGGYPVICYLSIYIYIYIFKISIKTSSLYPLCTVVIGVMFTNLAIKIPYPVYIPYISNMYPICIYIGIYDI